MFDHAPDADHKDDPRAWFLYFRMTKYLPAMPKKFEAEMTRAKTPETAKMVMTAYAAASLDVVLMYPLRRPLSTELETWCALKPAQMILLSVADIAPLLKKDTKELRDILVTGGFKIGKNDIITGFDAPPEVHAASQARRQAQRPRF